METHLTRARNRSVAAGAGRTVTYDEVSIRLHRHIRSAKSNCLVAGVRWRHQPGFRCSDRVMCLVCPTERSDSCDFQTDPAYSPRMALCSALSAGANFRRRSYAITAPSSHLGLARSVSTFRPSSTNTKSKECCSHGRSSTISC